MSKYIIEIEDEPFVRLSALFGEEGLYRAKGFNSLVFDQFGLDKLTPLDKALSSELGEAYQKGFEAGQHEATTLEYQQGLEEGKKQAKAQAHLDVCHDIERVARANYQKGVEEGKARNENGCVGCRYDNGRIDHSPCDYCCNAYSNQWSAKPCSDEIEVGDEVTYTFIDGAEIPPFVVFVIKDNGENRRYYEGYRRTDGKWVGGGLDYKKTGRHFPQVAELFKAMKEGAE